MSIQFFIGPPPADGEDPSEFYLDEMQRSAGGRLAPPLLGLINDALSAAGVTAEDRAELELLDLDQYASQRGFSVDLVAPPESELMETAGRFYMQCRGLAPGRGFMFYDPVLVEAELPGGSWLGS